MNRLLKWITRYKGALYISGAYGIVAILLYVLAILSGGDPNGAWYCVYISALPISYLFNFVAALLLDFLPDTLGSVLYSASPILAGMLWIYLISRCVFAVKARMRVSKRSDA